MSLAAAAATLATGVVIWGILNTLALFALSRAPRRDRWPALGFRFIFVIPALNEARVIGPTLRHLLALRPHAVVVVDDGSDDGTAEQVRAAGDPRVVLVRRRPPHARQGKGAALNAAYRCVLRSPRLAQGIDPRRVVLCVMDADGRLEPGALQAAARCLADRRVGACQVAVRIRNRRRNLWTAMQHFEFVAFAHLYQGGRERLRTVGLGGNGQFVRLDALLTLGPRPWSDCLTEDMDLGIRLLLRGWRTRFLPGTWVSQQAVEDLRTLLRQRARWFQGTLQCLRHLPAVLASDRLPLPARMDLVCALLTPLLLLALTPAVVGGWVWLGLSFAFSWLAPGVRFDWVLPAYALTFLPAVLLAYAYWRHEPETSPVRALGAGHAYTLYSLLWIAAGWVAAVRQLRRRSAWTRTPRVAEPEGRLAPAAWRAA